MSLVSNFRLTKISEPTTNATVNTDVDNVFESDLTTDTETDTETETENVHSHQKEILRKLEEEYVEIKSYRERLRANIDNYAKLLVQLDFGTLEDKNPSKFREGVYDRLEEHKNQMLVMFKDNHEDIKISLSDTILKQILNKRALQIEKDNSAAVYLKEYWHLAFDKVIINPKGYVRDYECKLSMPKDDLRGHNNGSACGYYIGSGSVYSKNVYKYFEQHNNNIVSERLGLALRSPTTWFISFFVLFHQGGEVSIGGWIVTFLETYRNADERTTDYVVSGFGAV
ncbi:hypothetical protein B5S30_g907 [[Candida] boidinii]|nr:hypothetical protein B5S30_g907 [[Candida] boidinii]